MIVLLDHRLQLAIRSCGIWNSCWWIALSGHAGCHLLELVCSDACDCCNFQKVCRVQLLGLLDKSAVAFILSLAFGPQSSQQLLGLLLASFEVCQHSTMLIGGCVFLAFGRHCSSLDPQHTW